MDATVWVQHAWSDKRHLLRERHAAAPGKIDVLETECGKAYYASTVLPDGRTTPQSRPCSHCRIMRANRLGKKVWTAPTLRDGVPWRLRSAVRKWHKELVEAEQLCQRWCKFTGSDLPRGGSNAQC